MRLIHNRTQRAERARVAHEPSETLNPDAKISSASAVERLRRLEVIIDSCLKKYVEIGKALREIRDERLYRAQGFKTFDAYCCERWGWKSRQVAYNYIAASQAAESVQTTGQNQPSLSQAVELATLPIEKQKDVAKTIESSGKSFGDVTVREVREMVQEIHAKTSAQAEEGVVRQDSQVPVSRIGDLWLCGNHRVLCGDSIHIGTVERVLKGGLADMVFTDPPYGVSYSGKTARKLTIQNDDLGPGFYEFLRTACSNALAVTRGAVYICMSSSEIDTLKRAFKDAGGHWSTFLIWAKHHFTLGRSDYQRQYEPMLYGWRDGGDHFWCGARDQGDVWYLKRSNTNREHPTRKPVELVERAIRNSSPTDATVLDPFGGSGTTIIACETLERQARLIEIEPQYCDVAVVRWQKFTGKSAVLEGDGRSFEQIAQERRKYQQETALQLDRAA